MLRMAIPHFSMGIVMHTQHNCILVTARVKKCSHLLEMSFFLWRGRMQVWNHLLYHVHMCAPCSLFHTRGKLVNFYSEVWHSSWLGKSVEHWNVRDISLTGALKLQWEIILNSAFEISDCGSYVLAGCTEWNPAHTKLEWWKEKLPSAWQQAKPGFAKCLAVKYFFVHPSVTL